MARLGRVSDPRRVTSLDARLGDALRARADDDAVWWELSGAPPEPSRTIDPRLLLAALAHADGPARTLLAEGALLAGTPRRLVLRRALVGPPGRLLARPDGALRALRLETDGARRGVIEAELHAARDAHRALAVSVVEALRAGLDAVADALPGSPRRSAALALLGLSTLPASAAAELVLKETEEPYRELFRHRARATGRKASSLADLCALVRARDADRLLPLADREGIASRWTSRVGLSLPRAGAMAPPSAVLPSPRVIVPRLGERPKIAFAPAPDAHGVLETAAVVGALLALPPPSSEPSIAALRLGTTRVAAPLSSWLARGLFLSTPFLVREASIDRGAVRSCARDLLFVHLTELRRAAFHSLALVWALDARGGLGELIAELHQRALSVPLAPAHAPFAVAEAFEGAAPAVVEAALLAPELERSLVSAHDEDWFRNPRAGGAIERALGLAALVGARGDAEPDAALAQRARELRQGMERMFRDAGA